MASKRWNDQIDYWRLGISFLGSNPNALAKIVTPHFGGWSPTINVPTPPFRPRQRPTQEARDNEVTDTASSRRNLYLFSHLPTAPRHCDSHFLSFQRVAPHSTEISALRHRRRQPTRLPDTATMTNSSLHVPPTPVRMALNSPSWAVAVSRAMTYRGVARQRNLR